MDKVDAGAIVEEILANIGPKANVARIKRSDTYMSLFLKDTSYVNVENLSKVEAITGVNMIDNQLQIITDDINDVYECLCETLEMKKEKSKEKEKKIMAKEDYNVLVDSIIELVGGKENVTFFTHCVTRLRFNFNDQSLVKTEEISKLPGALGAQWKGAQLQVIIGQSVDDVYKAICEKYGFNVEGSVEEVVENDKPKKKVTVGGVFNSILDGISGSLSPSIPALIGCGMIQVILIIATSLGMDETSGTYLLLYYAGQAGFYFLPVIVCGNAAKKFGGNQGLGMVVGGMLIYPDFIDAVGNGLNFLGISVYNTTYSSTIFPALLCGWVLAYIEKFFAKHSPEILRSILEPLCTLIIMVPLAYCVLGPVGAFLGTYISNAIIWLYETLGFVGVAVLAALMPFLIMTGMHSAFVPYLIQMFASVGYEPIFFPALVISNIDQGIASLAVAIKTKDKTLQSTALSCAITAVVGGVTEPAMYGVNLKYKRPMYGAMIGSAVAGAFAGIFNVVIYNFAGASSIVALPLFIDPDGGNTLIMMIIAILIGAVITFVATFILYKDEAEA